MADFSASFLQQINPEIIACCNYHKEYFERIQQDAAYFLAIYDSVLAQAEKSIQAKGKKKEEAHLLDFGCGNGLLGIYAKMKGWGSVSMMDINEHCTQNAKALTAYFQLQEVAIYTGSEEQLPDFLKGKKLPDVFISLDVIEHVYKIEHLLAILKTNLPTTTLFFSTGAIAENPLRSNHMKKLQLADEYQYTDALQTFSDNPFAGLNFREVREKIIKSTDEQQQLNEAEIATLVTKTRGQNKADIIASVKNYLQKGILPVELKHPTNTCDPISSSWTERLLTVKEYHEIFSNCGYNLSVHAGAYNDITHTGIKKGCLKLLNLLVKTFNLPQYSAYLLLEAAPR